MDSTFNIKTIAFNVNDRILFNLLFVCSQWISFLSFSFSFHLNSLCNFLKLEEILQSNQITFYSFFFHSSPELWSGWNINILLLRGKTFVFYSTNKNIFPLLRQYLLEFPYSTFSFSFQVVQFKNNHFRLLFHEHFSCFFVKHVTFEEISLVWRLQNKHF